MVPATAHVFGDESGECAITRGPRHFVIATVTTQDRSLASQLDSLAGALGHGEFHAKDDDHPTRRRVGELLGGQPASVDITVVDKWQLPPGASGGLPLYSRTVSSHFARVLRFLDPVLQVDFVMASIGPNPRKQHAFENGVRDAGAAASAAIGPLGGLNSRPLDKLVLDAGPIRVLTVFPPAKTDRCVQAADYCAWAARRKWEGNGDDYYRLIAGLVRSEEPL